MGKKGDITFGKKPLKIRAGGWWGVRPHLTHPPQGRSLAR